MLGVRKSLEKKLLTKSGRGHGPLGPPSHPCDDYSFYQIVVELLIQVTTISLNVVVQ